MARVDQIKAKTRLLIGSKSRDDDSCGSARSQRAAARKGHFAVYTREGRRFLIPIAYLNSSIFRELFRMSEEEFGLPAGDRPITFPCDAAFMEHVVASLRAEHATALRGWTKPCAAPFFI